MTDFGRDWPENYHQFFNTHTSKCGFFGKVSRAFQCFRVGIFLASFAAAGVCHTVSFVVSTLWYHTLYSYLENQSSHICTCTLLTLTRFGSFWLTLIPCNSFWLILTFSLTALTSFTKTENSKKVNFALRIIQCWQRFSHVLRLSEQAKVVQRAWQATSKSRWHIRGKSRSFRANFLKHSAQVRVHATLQCQQRLLSRIP